MKLRVQTLLLGIIPMFILAAVMTLETIPGTTIRLTVPYVAEGPGPTYDTLGAIDGIEIIEITGTEVDETDGTLSMTTVAVRSSMSFTQVLERWLVQGDTIIPREQLFPANTSDEEVAERNELAFSQSENNATIAALNYLDMPVYAMVAGVQDGAAAAGILQEGDVVTQVDDTVITGPAQLSATIQEYAPGTTVTVHFIRDGEEETAEITLGDVNDERAMLGVAVVATPGDGVEVTYSLKDVGGPSAGMIFSLAVIDKLSEGSLTGGKKVAGTGTISEDGTVGPIGGITHKIQAAAAAGHELFLAPESNCAEAATADAGDMVVAAVSSLDDAIAAMEAFANGEEVTTCS